MSLPGGIRTKFAVALVVIIAAAQAAAYLLVVPSLERRLVEAKLDQLAADATTIAGGISTGDISSNPFRLDGVVRGLGNAFNARVVVFSVLGPPLVLQTLSDSVGASPTELTRDPVALAAARSGAAARARIPRAGGQYAEVAIPLFASGNVVLLSASLGDQLATVRLAERRIGFATALAVAIALVLGSVVTALHARRLRRLERAANRIAEGHFDEPVVGLGEDELGQLAEAFDRMRVQLAQLDRARKEFVANASHELRTPLFSLAGFLELMADEDLDDDTRARFLATTREQVDRLTRLAGDLLDLSRMDTGRLRVECEEVSLVETAQALVEELAPLAESSGHTLDVETDSDVWAMADEERVLQIGRALAGNALVHTPPGTRVVVRARRSGDRAVLSVEDDGPGIPPEHLDRIFDRFYRIEGGQASGSGLGLAIARELAGRMSGSVSVETRPGRTVFSLAVRAEPGVVAPPALAVDAS